MSSFTKPEGVLIFLCYGIFMIRGCFGKDGFVIASLLSAIFMPQAHKSAGRLDFV
jgi:hypothetical protein